MEVLLICLGEGIAAKRQQFVCGDSGCGSGVPQARLSSQFLHALGCDFRHITKDRHQSLFTFRYRYCLTFSEGADGML